jgi:hypothetical protein
MWQLSKNLAERDMILNARAERMKLGTSFSPIDTIVRNLRISLGTQF